MRIDWADMITAFERNCLRAVRFGLLLSSVVMISGFTEACGQETADASGEEQEVKEFADRYDERFLEREPKVGTDLPEMEAFDADGLPFDFNSTRGSYTVVVFGCLT